MKKNVRLTLFLLFSFSLFISQGCENHESPNLLDEPVTFQPPDWSYNATIYEVNVRQYTKEGTFKAFADHLPRLKEMGVDILWFMPVHPIGVKNRKGSLGSYYSVQNFKDVNPEFGTLQDFKSLVESAHQLGMYVILDWVANHTSWDNVWVESNPEFYTRDNQGNFVSPFDWTDVIDLNYENKELWNSMRDAMKFWVDEYDIDGFRCDVAAMVPLEFWKWLRPQLETNKPLFMLAEAHEPELHNAFDMTYNWQLKDLFVGIAEGRKSGADLHRYFSEEKTTYPSGSFRMTFTTNHDENSWHGTDNERFGDFAKQFAVISCLVNGMPLVYSGMEGGLNKRLAFFEKDPIEWKTSEYSSIYSKLFELKKENKALWNGMKGGEMLAVDSDDPDIFAFIRNKDENKVFAIFNLSGNQKKINISNDLIKGEYNNLFTGESKKIERELILTIEPYSYLVLYR